MKLIKAVLITLAVPVTLTVAAERETEPRWLAVTDSEPWDPVRVSVTRSSEVGQEVAVTLPGVFPSPVTAADKQEYTQLTVPGCGATARKVGLPEMPIKTFFLEIPYGVEASVELVDETTVTLGTGYKVYPLQPPLPDSGHAEIPPFVIDEEAYATDTFFPPRPVVLGNPGFIRGRRVVVAGVFPLRYNPATTELQAYAALRFNLVFSGDVDPTGQAQRLRLATPEWETLAAQLILNYEPVMPLNRQRATGPPAGDTTDYLIIVADNISRQSSHGSYSLEEESLPLTDSLEEESLPLPGSLEEESLPLPGSLEEESLPLPGSLEEESLPLAGSLEEESLPLAYSLEEEIQPLADWKYIKGLSVHVARMSEIGSTADDIKSYIQDTFDPPPSYVLLVGDSDDVPSHVYSGSYPCDTTDYPYSCVVGDDLWPDLTVARLPVHTEDECINVVDKILGYECTPDSGHWYDDFLVAAYFQDSNDDSEADRWFMETAMTIHDFLVNERGFEWHTALCTTYWPLRHATYHFRSSSYPHRADLNEIRWGASPYPDPVPAWIVDLWTSASQATLDVSTAINEGVGNVLHRDHGGETLWGDPPYGINDIDNLANGAKTPVVFSINCSTGSFQRPEGDCFCERFLKKSPGGCVGTVGATRVSYSGWNDLLAHGIYASLFWPAYDPTFIEAPPSRRPAVALNYAKLYMATFEDLQGWSGDLEQTTESEEDYLGANDDITKSEMHMFHWFGDPEMMLRTATPGTLLVNHPSSVSCDEPVNITVTVDKDGAPLAGALVAISHPDPAVGDHWSGLTDESGAITFSLIELTEEGDYNVVVSAHNCVPYVSTLTSDTGPVPFPGPLSRWIQRMDDTFSPEAEVSDDLDMELDIAVD